MSKLFLLPNHLGNSQDMKNIMPACLDDIVATLDGIISESPQGGRSYLNKFRTKKPPYDIPLALLNEHTKDDEIDFILKPIKEGQIWGLISDAGLCCLADPGAKLVSRAKQIGIEVHTFGGPSSITMAIQLSGLPSQRFSFHGYIAKEPYKRDKDIIRFEKRSSEDKALQIFIEAPYRNKTTLESLLSKLSDETQLAIATDLTLETERVICQKVETYKKMPLPNLDKKPAVFLIYSASN
jgi:16S rRNA (cytidine1402-2'-O)-methyltransferase